MRKKASVSYGLSIEPVIKIYLMTEVLVVKKTRKREIFVKSVMTVAEMFP